MSAKNYIQKPGQKLTKLHNSMMIGESEHQSSAKKSLKNDGSPQPASTSEIKLKVKM
jgi:hypothetical protein